MLAKAEFRFLLQLILIMISLTAEHNKSLLFNQIILVYSQPIETIQITKRVDHSAKSDDGVYGYNFKMHKPFYSIHYYYCSLLIQAHDTDLVYGAATCRCEAGPVLAMPSPHPLVDARENVINR